MNRQDRERRAASKNLGNPFQRFLAMRILTWWSCTWLVVFALPIMTRMVTGQVAFAHLASEVFNDFWFPAAVSLILVPLLVWDSIRLSHRVVGPARRLSNAIQAIAEGQPVEPIRLRDGDFGVELAESINQLIESRSIATARNGTTRSRAGICTDHNNQLATACAHTLAIQPPSETTA